MRFLHLSLLPFLLVTWLTAVVLAYPVDRQSGSGVAIREAPEVDGASFALRFDSGDVESLEAREPGAKITVTRTTKKKSRGTAKGPRPPPPPPPAGPRPMPANPTPRGRGPRPPPPPPPVGPRPNPDHPPSAI